MNQLLQKVGKNVTYPTGRVNGAICVSYGDDDFDSSDSDDGECTDKLYEQKFVEKELKRYGEPTNTGLPKGFADDVSTFTGFSEVDSMFTGRKSLPAEVYRTYNFKLNTDIKKQLPIDSYKQQILSRIDLNQVIVIEGPTGCGKTTQVPQMIMDSFREKNMYCNIVVTQPRKIATINVAKRVCQERGWALGTVCGYQVGLEKKLSPDVIITYMTIGVLLQKLIQAKSLRQYTHIVIDEVHERNQELDFLLLIVRKFLFTNSPQTKIVLMSATIKADEFAYYFRRQTFGQTIRAPIISINKESPYTKTIFYLEQIDKISQNMPKLDLMRPNISNEVWNVFLFLVAIFDRLERGDSGMNRNGTVLVFLPGIYEIEEAHSRLAQEDPDGKKWDIIPLHSSLPNDEQARAFMPSKSNTRKIILSTNIAESSVTVPDSSFVIDFCQTKVMTVNPETKYSTLKLEWASHVNCDQRAGRVGRTCDGRVYRLVTREFYMEMNRHGTPEILNSPLEHVVLQAKMLELDETPAQILALAMSPPALRNIETTIWLLKEIGGLLKTCRGVPANADGDITFLGRVMAGLPLDVHLAKLIVLGQLFSCLEETIVIAAGCSIQNIFSVPFQRRLDAYRKLLVWSDGSCSDLIALLNLYTVWVNLKRENAFASHREEMFWCRTNLVSLKGLKEWNLLIMEIKQRLERMEIKETDGPGKVTLGDTEKPMVLKVIVAGAFYPNFFIKTPDSSQMTEREAVKTVGGRDPFSTVYFTGMDPKQPGQVYVRSIKRLIREDGERETDVQIGFDGSSKIYVEFKGAVSREPITVNVDGHKRLTNVPGRVPLPVYEILRKRQLHYPFQLTVLPFNEAWEFAEKHGLRRNMPSGKALYQERRNCYSSVQYSPLPTMDTTFISLHISNFINTGNFWAQNATEETNVYLQQIDEALNKQVLMQVTETVKLDKIYAARFREDGQFYRCKVLTTGGRVHQIRFIDYGNLQEVQTDELYYVPQRPQCVIAPLAFKCELHGVKPTFRFNPSGVWDEEVNTDFKKLTEGILLYGEVYSVVEDVVELTLYRSENKEISLNQYLLNKHFAEVCAPSFRSEQNHQQRLAVQAAENPDQEANRLAYDKIVSYSDFMAPQVDHGRHHTVIHLRGPFSPLEVKLYCCTMAGSSKSVDVEGTSVNAVLLDNEPESPHARLLVAAHVSQTGDGNRLKLRQTTLMPNLPGLPMLLAVIFCPTMEPKLTNDNTLVAAVLCGLGCNDTTGKPLYPVHDICLTLDTELTIEELEMINRLRYLMNAGVKLLNDIERNMSTQKELVNTQIKIKEHLFKLIKMERVPIDRRNVAPRSTAWGKHGGLGLLKPSMDNDEQDIWGLLWFVKLAGQTEALKCAATNLEMMKDMSLGIIPFEEIKCVLCETELLSVYEVRLHLVSPRHKEAAERYQERLEEIDDDEDDE
ncbi:probable ATP-dependent RNA helicase spindle-E [Cylas formicarius]|uniref:probable ATP-dependent RNA helicase spindle-E n=1 Tax=Cylas formicarius TaxID=197179 RepID=UPI002958A4EC|nr:probable ATP-dependent RNA helicase spindle-E [Cylas formicarius]